MTTTAESGEDARILRSRDAMRAALLGLLAAGADYSSISVSDLARRAGVTRKTFYAHYDSVDAVVSAMARDLFAGGVAALDDAALLLPLGRGFLGQAIFRRLALDVETVAPLVLKCPGALFLEPAVTVMRDDLLPRLRAVNGIGPPGGFEQAYLFRMAGAVLHAALFSWASRSFEDSPDTVAALVMEVLAPVADRILLGGREAGSGEVVVND
ncbi:MAG: TetR/AcrR family transcriptional regulator [Pseudomonadales bacterium]